ncbi:MAG: DUF86 domain-containing protein [Desulfobacteraceae bacterium]|nr:DUF86 domain-containing protein [Desulfobacteraceae bacterium]
MVNFGKISVKFEMLDQFLQVLRGLSETEEKKFLEDSVLIGSLRYYLQVSIECCLDVSAHIIASERYRAPKDYADTFKVLEERKVVDPALAHRLQQMAKFRNRLVHLYGEIDDRAVYRIAHEYLKDIEDFKKAILTRFSY